MEEAKNNRDLGIDFLRAVSVLYIVGFWHLLSYTKPVVNYDNLLTNSITIVALGTFVFVSGYLIGLKEIDFTKEVNKFYINKLVRIYPLYLVALIIFAVMNLTDLAASVKAAFLVSMFVQPAPLTLWFITMLMFFYFIAPMTVIIYEKLGVKKFLLTLSFFILCLGLYSYFTQLLDTRLIMYLPSFAVGILVGKKDQYVLSNKIYIFLGLLFAASLTLFSITEKTSFSLLLVGTTLSLFGSFLLFNITKAGAYKMVGFHKGIHKLAYGSYCMYLFHRPLYIFFKSFYFPESSFYQILYLALIIVPIIIIIAYIVQKLYDSMLVCCLKRQ